MKVIRVDYRIEESVSPMAPHWQLRENFTNPVTLEYVQGQLKDTFRFPPTYRYRIVEIKETVVA